MGEKIIVGPVGKGLQKNLIPVYIDNDSFPVLINAYQWRGRIKRKRGTSLLSRLRRFFDSSSTSYYSGAEPTLNGAGDGNLFTSYSLEDTTAQLVPGTITIVGSLDTYTDDNSDGDLFDSGAVLAGTINYGLSTFTVAAEAGATLTSSSFLYFPGIPVMGLRDFVDPTIGVANSQFPFTLGFDTTYAYNVLTTSPYQCYDISFYKNPSASAAFPNYAQKGTWSPLNWNGEDYRQFWTVNYQGALWATNSLNVPFASTSYSMQYNIISTTTNIVAGPPGQVDIAFTAAHGLEIGDFVWVNEVQTTTGINFQTGYVIALPSNMIATVEFPNATIATNGTGGIAQYLTKSFDSTKDCIRWYDGDPTNGSATAPVLNGTKGWVNFCPPISQFDISIGDLPADQYYLVGCKFIKVFKDRLCFFGVIVQTAAAGSQKYLSDVVIYCQNGTPFYTSSFTLGAGDTLTTASTQYNPVLVPVNQTATANAYFSDSTGFGGFVSANIDDDCISVGESEDVLIVGFTQRQTRFVYTSNDIIPFIFYTINAELGTQSQFSAIDMDKGTMSMGMHGFVVSDQNSTSRFDQSIPDEIFEVRLQENGSERVTAIRDFDQEWNYFTYPQNNIDYKFPTTTLQYNYRENTWGKFYETYTTYGRFQKRSGLTWATVGTIYPTWAQWNDAWNSSSTTLLQPEIIAGNQEGFILSRNDGTAEGNSLAIRDIATNTITVPNHCLNQGDYILISGALGTVGAQINGNVFSVGKVNDDDTFTLNPPISAAAYIGSGVIKRMYIPFIQTKQFPPAWGMSRKTRLGPQQYLFTTTANSQVSLWIYLSQNADQPYNIGPIIPDISINDSLVYNTVLYTCPESSNLGLTPFNTNLQMISNINPAGDNASSPQANIWHRVNTSLIGDTIQVAITLDDTQMRDPTLTNQFAEIELHGFILDVSSAGWLA